MTILVAVELSRASLRLLNFAQRLALKCGAQVCLLHVADPDPDFVGYEPGPQNVRMQVAHKYQGAHRKLQLIGGKLRRAKVQTTALLVQGPTAELILSEAEKLQADLIVLGASRHTALRRALLGSVTTQVIRNAPVPVVIVPLAAPRAKARPARKSATV